MTDGNHGNQRFGGRWRCQQLTIYYVFSCWAAAHPVPSNGLSGTGIMLYVGGNTMHCNFWCGHFAMLLPWHSPVCFAHDNHVKNCSGTIVTGKLSRIDTWFKIAHMTSGFASDICVCVQVCPRKSSIIYGISTTLKILPSTTSIHHFIIIRWHTSYTNRKWCRGDCIYKSMTEDESSQQPQEKHSLVVSQGLEDFCQQLPLWLWLCGNQPSKLASKVPFCDYCTIQRHVCSRCVLPQNELILSFAISESSSQISLRQKTQPP